MVHKKSFFSCKCNQFFLLLGRIMKVYIKSKQMIPEEMRADLELRWNRLRNYMRENEMDACLLANGVNIYYTTGKMYNGYFYLPVEGEPCFFVKRPGGYAGDRVRYIRKPEEIVGHLEALGMSKPARLMLEADELTYNEYLRLRAVFAPEREGKASWLNRLVPGVWSEYGHIYGQHFDGRECGSAVSIRFRFGRWRHERRLSVGREWDALERRNGGHG